MASVGYLLIRRYPNYLRCCSDQFTCSADFVSAVRIRSPAPKVVRPGGSREPRPSLPVCGEAFDEVDDPILWGRASEGFDDPRPHRGLDLVTRCHPLIVATIEHVTQVD